ncbi:MAG: hypothetical protein EXS09_22590 [Gemmataceae bacterium]|nr:hypothetical protein [Gemmataceae bacterium]
MTINEEDRAEAKRLKLLPKAEQRQIVRHIRSVADNPKVPDADRKEAIRRGKALAELLKLNPKKK